MGAKFDAFATGFADGFITQRNAREERNARFGDDLLRNRISKWDEEKKKKAAQESADAALLAQARGIVGNTSLPTHVRESEALALVVNDLKTYDDPKYVAERFETAIARGAFESIAADPTNMSIDNEMNNIMLSGGAATRDDSISGMNDAFRNNLSTAMSTLPEDLKGKVTVFSGYRNAGVQANIVAENMGKYGFSGTDVNEWKSDVANLGPEAAGEKWASRFNGTGLRQYVALPGSSKHQQGKAADLMFDGTRLDRIDAETRDRIHSHMEQYGLTFRMSHEPWQVELAEDNSGAFRNSTEMRSEPVAPATETQTDTGEKPLFERVVDSFFGLDKDYYIKQADDNFRKYLESTGELELYNQVRSGRSVLSTPSSSLKYNTTKMNLDVKEPPALSSVNSLDDIAAIRSQVKAFGIPVPATYMSELDALQTRYENLANNVELKPINELTSKGAVQATAAYVDQLDEAAKKALPAGYVKSLETLVEAYADEDTPETITRGFIATKYFTLQEAAKSGNADDVAAFNLFENATLPSMLEAIEAANPEDKGVPALADLIAQKDLILRSQNPESPENKAELDRIEAGISANLQASRAEAQAKNLSANEILVKRKDGSWVIREARRTADGSGFEGLGEDEEALDVPKSVITNHASLIKLRDDETNKYQLKVDNLQGMMTLAGEAMQAAATPIGGVPFAVLKAPNVMQATASASRLAKETKIALELLDSYTQRGELDPENLPADVELSLQAIEKMINEESANRTTLQSAAAAKELLDAKLVLMTFRLGGLEGQSGAAMSNRDYDRLRNTIQSTDPENFKRLLSEYISGHVKVIDQNYNNNIINNTAFNSWSQSAGVDFWNGSEKPKSVHEQLQGQEYNFFVKPNLQQDSEDPDTPTTTYNVGDTYKGKKIVGVYDDKIVVETADGQRFTLKAK